MNRNPGMNRFFVEACHVYGPQPGKRRWQYRIRDKDQIVPMLGAKVVAYAHDSEIADKIAATLEAGDHDSADKFAKDAAFSIVLELRAQIDKGQANALELEKRWQSTLDFANRQRGLEKLRADMLKDEADRLRNQLLEAREQRDEAREGEVKMRLEAARALTERDELQAKLDKLLGGASPADNEILLALARHINRVCFKS